MILTARQDIYGIPEFFTAKRLRQILDLLDSYMNEKPYHICEIRQDDVNDKHGRVDIEIRYTDENHRLYEQKLLILNDEVIDGRTFHKRYSEWY